MKPFDRLLSISMHPACFVGFWIFAVASFLYLDKPIAYQAQHLALHTYLPVLIWITHIGLGGLYFVPLFVLALVFRYVYKKPKWEVRTWFLWLCVVIPSMVCLLLKVTLGRARPELLFQEGLYGFYGFSEQASYWSFPSGHSTTIMGLVLGLSILFPRYGYGFMCVGVCVVVSRVLLMHHYLTDVLVASYLVVFEVALLRYFIRRYVPRIASVF